MTPVPGLPCKTKQWDYQKGGGGWEGVAISDIPCFVINRPPPPPPFFFFPVARAFLLRPRDKYKAGRVAPELAGGPTIEAPQACLDLAREAYETLGIGARLARRHGADDDEDTAANEEEEMVESADPAGEQRVR